jgi:hypothetical protein
VYFRWLYLGFRTGYEFPFSSLHSLFLASLNEPIDKGDSEINRVFSESRLKFDKKLFNVYAKAQEGKEDDFDTVLDLENLDSMYMEVFEFLAPSDVKSRERLAEYWEDNRQRMKFISSITSRKTLEIYPRLYKKKIREKKNERKSKAKSILDRVLDYLYSQEPSENLIKETRERLNQLTSNKTEFSISDLALIRRFDNFLKMLEEKLDENKSGILGISSKYNDLLNDYRHLQDDPFYYLQRFWDLNFIAIETVKTGSATRQESRYHHHPDCTEWRRQAFEYLIEKKYHPSAKSRFRVSDSKEDFLDKEECKHCRKKSAKL